MAVAAGGREALRPVPARACSRARRRVRALQAYASALRLLVPARNAEVRRAEAEEVVVSAAQNAAELLRPVGAVQLLEEVALDAPGRPLEGAAANAVGPLPEAVGAAEAEVLGAGALPLEAVANAEAPRLEAAVVAALDAAVRAAAAVEAQHGAVVVVAAEAVALAGAVPRQEVAGARGVEGQPQAAAPSEPPWASAFRQARPRRQAGGACAMITGAVCAWAMGLAKENAVRAVVASSTRRSLIMMNVVPESFGSGARTTKR